VQLIGFYYKKLTNVKSVKGDLGSITCLYCNDFVRYLIFVLIEETCCKQGSDQSDSSNNAFDLYFRCHTFHIVP